MRYALETTVTLGPLAGIGHYVQNLSEALLPLLGHDEQLFGFDGLSFARIDPPHSTVVSIPKDATAKDVKQTLARAKFQTYLLLRSVPPIRAALRYAKEVAFRTYESDFDVFHAVQTVPPGPFKKPLLPTIHDLSHIRFPQAHPNERVRWLERGMKLLVDQVPIIQTVSQFSKREIVELLGVSEDRIHVSYPGVGRAFSDPPWSSEEQVACLRNHDIRAEHYFLMVSTREPRKNFRTVAEAYAAMPDRLRESIPLVWVGQPGWGDLDLSQSVERAIKRGEIRVMGYVSEQSLVALYQHARLFLMPSIYEGFGMPITEALSCGTALALSDIPVFREVAGKFARFVDPLDIAGWRAAMVEAAQHPLMPVNREAATQWLQRYTWAQNAAQTLEIYRHLAREAA